MYSHVAEGLRISEACISKLYITSCKGYKYFRNGKEMALYFQRLDNAEKLSTPNKAVLL